MSDHATRQAKRSGDLAAQLAAEVRVGRPERARLRAYCGCEAARHTYGHVAWSCGLEADDCRAAWCAYHHGELFLCAVCNQAEVELTKDCPGYSVRECNLPDWLTGLQRLAWAPPLWVPCGQHCTARRPCCVPGGHHESYSHPCLRCGDPERGHAGAPGKVLANVDPAQWVLAVAACGVARACQVAECYENRPDCTRTRCTPILAAIDAAERWTRCPCTNCLHVWHERCADADQEWLPDPLWVAGDWVDTFNAAAQIIGPDAAREAAARAVLTALED